jgi:selT/selW/selH-like putative selenoprotein
VPVAPCAAWISQELLTTFSADIGEIALMPGAGDVFEIRIGDEAVWSRAEKGRFPEIKELKQMSGIASRPARAWAIPFLPSRDSTVFLAKIPIALWSTPKQLPP